MITEGRCPRRLLGPWFWVYLVLGATLLVSCQREVPSQKAPKVDLPPKPAPSVPPEKTQVPAVAPALEGFFVPKRVGVFSVVEGLKMNASNEELSAISKTLGSGKRWEVPGFSGVSIQDYLTPKTKRLRYLSIRLPKGVLPQIERAWGLGQRAQLNGRRDGIFWFDESRGVQVSMPDGPQATRLTVNPFLSLEALIAPPTDAQGEAAAALIGAQEAPAKARFSRTMKRPRGQGFVAWTRPLRYQTHPVSLRVVVEDSLITGVSFPLSGMVHGGSISHLVDLISSRWGQPSKVERLTPEVDPSRWIWTNFGLSMALGKGLSGTTSKTSKQRLMVSLVAEGQPQPVKGLGR